MRLRNFKDRVILVAFSLFFAPVFVNAADFKIKPLVISGEAAPSGGVFGFIGDVAINNPGAIAFIAQAGPGIGVYLAAQESVTTIVDNSINFSGRVFLNDAGALVFDTGSFSNPVLFSGGALVSLNSPSLRQLLVDLSGDKFLRISSLTATALTNTSVVALKAFTIENSTLNVRSFLTTGGVPTHVPLVGTPAPGGETIRDASILDMNDSGGALVWFVTSFGPFGPGPGGLFLESAGSRIPIAIPGALAIEGKTFTNAFQLARINSAGEILFVAQLSDFRLHLFRRTPDGTLTSLARSGMPLPGGGAIFDFSHIDLNDNGDVAFIANFNSGVFFLSASDSSGVPVKVARSFESAPGGGTFQMLAPFSLNNMGEIAFRADLSTGKAGIFLGGAGLETEFVDPVPDLLADGTITSDQKQLAEMGRLVTGIAADGAARVVVRVKTGQPGTVEFSLVDQNGAALPPSNFNGSLSQVGEDMGSGSVSVEAKDVQGVGPMAFAAYHAPMDFASSPDSTEAGQPDRRVFIRVKLTTSTGETVESTEPLKIVRPPVILVHGLWGSPKAWDAFSPLNGTSLFWVNLADYEDTHARALSFNMPLMALQTKASVQDFKLTRQLAAIQADVVTHSMGGLLMRMLPLLEDVYFRDDNFGHGDVHKLINIDTPHLGTPLALFLQLSPCVSRFFDSHDHPTSQGAVEDLIPGSRSLREINSVPSSVELHNVVGLTGIAGIELTEGSPAYLWLRLRCRGDFRGTPVSGFFDAVLGTRDHDLIVPGVSQQGRATTNVTTVIGVIHTQVEFFFQGVGVLESTDASNRVINLLNTPINSVEFDTFVGFP